jgi:hypothetical protein
LRLPLVFVCPSACMGLVALSPVWVHNAMKIILSGQSADVLNAKKEPRGLLFHLVSKSMRQQWARTSLRPTLHHRHNRADFHEVVEFLNIRIQHADAA